MTRKIASVRPLCRSALPSWIVFPVLAGLVLVSGLIVALGWLIAAPAPRAAQTGSAFPPSPPVLRGRGTGGEGVSAADGDLPPPIAPPAPEASEPPLEPARELPMFGETVPPTLRTAPMPIETPRAVTLAPKLELKWVIEKLPANPRGDTSHLIMPIEIAKLPAAPIPYSVRRLSLPGEAPKPPKLALTPFVHDDVARLLTELGQGQRLTKIPKENLQSMEILKLYDVLFLTCAELYARDAQASAFLRKYVELGGTLYASDLQYDRLLWAFPEFQAKQKALPGIQQNVEAAVTDRGLEAYLGHKTIPLSFDAPDWRPASFDPAKVTVCLQGVYRDRLGKPGLAPLLVKFRHGQGTVIFTSFHHSRNETPIVRKMLEYLAIAPLNARNEARIHEMMRRSNFAANDLRPLLLQAGQPAKNTYEHPGGGLQIAIGFEHVGAKIKLTMRAPDGQTIEYEDQSLYLIEVPEAAAGAWHYTITPIDLPQRSLPMINAIGRTKG